MSVATTGVLSPIAAPPVDELTQCAQLTQAMLGDLGAVVSALYPLPAGAQVAAADASVSQQAYSALAQTAGTCVSAATFGPWKAAAAKLAQVLAQDAVAAGNSAAQASALAVQQSISATSFGTTQVNWLLPVGAIAIAVAGYYAYQSSVKVTRAGRSSDEGEGEEFTVNVDDDGEVTEGDEGEEGDDEASLSEHQPEDDLGEFQPEDDLAGGSAWDRATKKRTKWSKKKK